MRNLIKRISVIILVIVTVLAMSIPAFAATQERFNKNTAGGATTGNCEYCGKSLGTTTCVHGSYDSFDATYHKCNNCEATFAHKWNNGRCSVCNLTCPECGGTDEIGGCTKIRE